MPNFFWRILDRVPTWLVITVSVSLIAPTAWWAVRPSQMLPHFTVTVVDSESRMDSGSPARKSTIPPAALTATLRDVLFDAPPAPVAPPPSPPKLDLELIAISGSDERRVAFAHAPALGEFLELKPGDITAQGAAVTEVGETHILCVLGDREIRVELAP